MSEGSDPGFGPGSSRGAANSGIYNGDMDKTTNTETEITCDHCDEPAEFVWEGGAVCASWCFVE